MKHIDPMRRILNRGQRTYWIRHMRHTNFRQAERDRRDNINEYFAPRAAHKLASEGMAFCLHGGSNRIRMVEV